MNNEGNRCPECQSNNTVIDKIPGEEIAHLFICDSCGHFHNCYKKDSDKGEVSNAL